MQTNRIRRGEYTLSKIIKDQDKTEDFVETKEIEFSKKENEVLDQRLEVELSLTENLGNFRSLKMGVKLSLPTSEKRKEKDYEMTKTWIQDKIKQEMADVHKKINKQ